MKNGTVYVFNEIGRSTKIYFPDGGKWVRGYLKEVLGSRAYMTYIKHEGNVWWCIKRANFGRIVTALKRKYVNVQVTKQYSKQNICDKRCQNANPYFDYLCECSCGGKNHGHEDPDYKNVKDDLLVETKYFMVQRLYTHGAEQYARIEAYPTLM